MIETKRPWFREGLVWLVIGLPAAAVVGGIITAVIAMSTSDGLVADDYYKQGMAINQTMARDELARQLGLEAEIRITQGRVAVSLSAKSGPLPEALHLTLVHPTRAGEDQSRSLARVGSEYAGDLGPIAAGRWEIHLEDESKRWRMNGETYLPASEAVRITSRSLGR